MPGIERKAGEGERCMLAGRRGSKGNRVQGPKERRAFVKGESLGGPEATNRRHHAEDLGSRKWLQHRLMEIWTKTHTLFFKIIPRIRFAFSLVSAAFYLFQSEGTGPSGIRNEFPCRYACSTHWGRGGGR